MSNLLVNESEVQSGQSNTVRPQALHSRLTSDQYRYTTHLVPVASYTWTLAVESTLPTNTLENILST